MLPNKKIWFDLIWHYLVRKTYRLLIVDQKSNDFLCNRQIVYLYERYIGRYVGQWRFIDEILQWYQGSVTCRKCEKLLIHSERKYIFLLSLCRAELAKKIKLFPFKSCLQVSCYFKVQTLREYVFPFGIDHITFLDTLICY